MPTTWTPINDSQGASWDNAKTFGYLLLESGLDNFLIQETAPAPLNRFIISVPVPSATWNNINDSQGAVWIPVNVST